MASQYTDSSSDDSFVWANKSSGSSSSEAMVHEVESDFDKTFKKKLQKELFQNGDHEEFAQEAPRRRKKNVKRERASPPRAERESAAAAAAEASLRLKVKQERASLAAAVTRAPSEPPGEPPAEPRAGDERQKKNKKAKRERPPEPLENGDVAEAEEPPPKKKKKKHKRKTSETSELERVLVDKFEAEETAVAPAPARRPPGRASPPHRALSVRARIAFEEDPVDRSEPESEPERTLNNREPIAVEEGPVDRSESERSRLPAASGRLARYLRAHAHLSAAAAGEAGSGAGVAADDDVWLVRAPRSLRPAALAGAALAAGGRCRLKADGRGYEAAPAAGGARAALLLPRAGAGWRARCVRLAGTLRLRARLPRAGAPGAAAAAPPSPPAVPLPATRLRHPLLGADFARRRDDDGAEVEVEKKKKKKKKKKKTDPPAQEPEPAPALGRWDSERAIEQSLFGM